MREYGRWPVIFKGVRLVMNHNFLNHTLDSNKNARDNAEDIVDIKAFSKRSFTFQYDFTDQEHNLIANKSPINLKFSAITVGPPCEEYSIPPFKVRPKPPTTGDIAAKSPHLNL